MLSYHAKLSALMLATAAQVLAKHDARMSFTCVEMRDCEHPPEGRCSPQGASGMRSVQPA